MNENDEWQMNKERDFKKSSLGNALKGTVDQKQDPRDPKNLQSPEKGKHILWIVDGCIVAAIVLLVVFLFLLPDLKKKKKPSSAEDKKATSYEDDEAAARRVTWNGETYSYNEDLFTVLVMGIDRDDIDDSGDEVKNTAGQNDVNLLLLLDKKTGEVKILPINRDTMTDVDYYNQDGKYMDTSTRHLCLAWAYAGGGEQSGKSVEKSISRLLYDVDIDRYLAVDFGAIKKANDAVGGVTVTVPEDIGTKWKAGETVTLHGDDAETFIRYRITSESGGNTLRMEREKIYFSAFLSQMKERMKQDLTVPLSLFSSLSNSDDMETDLTGSEFSDLVTEFSGQDITDANYLTIEGQVKYNSESLHDEFYPDDDKLYQLVLDAFYRKDS